MINDPVIIKMGPYRLYISPVPNQYVFYHRRGRKLRERDIILENVYEIVQKYIWHTIENGGDKEIGIGFTYNLFTKLSKDKSCALVSCEEIPENVDFDLKNSGLIRKKFGVFYI